MAAKRALAGEHLGGGCFGEFEIEFAKALRQRLAGVAGQHWLGIKRVELARAPMHEERDHCPGPRPMVAGPGSQRVGSHPLPANHAKRRQSAKPEACLGEEIAAGERSIGLAEHRFFSAAQRLGQRLG